MRKYGSIAENKPISGFVTVDEEESALPTDCVPRIKKLGRLWPSQLVLLYTVSLFHLSVIYLPITLFWDSLVERKVFLVV